MAEIPDDLDRERRHWRSVARGRPKQAPKPGPGEESVWDYPRPPRLEPAGQLVRVMWAGVELARSERALRVVETASPPTYYVPPEDVRREALVASRHRTFCEWKGVATYWHTEVGDRRVENAAWSYAEPDAGFERLRDHLAFFAGRVDGCWVGDDRVVPQAGDFYGGWVTPRIVGPFKGDPGTEGW